MGREHRKSKDESRSRAAPIRREAATHLSSNARGVFDLQHAAGNRAVAKLLTASASGVNIQRTAPDPSPAGPISLVTVQRLGFDEALKMQVAPSEQEEMIPKLASALIAGADTLLKGPDTAAKAEDAKKAEGAATDATAEVKTEPASTTIPSSADLDEREKALTAEPTEEEQALLDRQEKLNALQAFKARVRKLGLSPEQQADLEKDPDRDIALTELEALKAREQKLKLTAAEKKTLAEAHDKDAALTQLEDLHSKRDDLKARAAKLKLTADQRKILSRVPDAQKESLIVQWEQKKKDAEDKKKDADELKKYMDKINKPYAPGRSMADQLKRRSF